MLAVATAALLSLGPLSPGSSQLPRTPPNWALNRSTIIMPCNSTGLLDPSTTAGWAVVDFDVRRRLPTYLPLPIYLP